MSETEELAGGSASPCRAGPRKRGCPRRSAAAVALAAAISVAGCGDSDAAEGPATAPSPPPNASGPAPAPREDAPPPRVAGPRFEECAEARGLRFVNRFLEPEQGERFRINLYDHGSGTVVADFDGDGHDDVLLLGQMDGNGLFRNDGSGRFENVTARAGVGLADRISVGGAAADVDGDGDVDLYLTTVRGGNVLFRNRGDGTFEDVTEDAGLTLVMESMAAAFFDADRDGDVDLLVTNTARWTEDSRDDALSYWRGKASLAELVRSPPLHDVFYRNDGKGRFTDATDEAGLRGRGWGGDITVFDIEGDGDLDLFVCNMFGRSTLYANDGAGRFADVTRAALGRTSWGAVGARAFDHDGDGRMDVFVSDMHSDMWIPFNARPDVVEESRKYFTFMQRGIEMRVREPFQEREFEIETRMQRGEVVLGNCLHRNRGDGTFEEVSDRAGTETWWPWGCVEGDFDGDGWLDVFMPSGMGYPLFYWRSPLLRNRGDGTFTDVCRSAGTEPPPGGPEMDLSFRGKRVARSARSAAVADFDGDGRVDLVVNNFNERAYLYRNVSAPSRWCSFRLTGTRSGRDAIGALVTVTAGGRTLVRQVQSTGGYLSQSSAAVHFGLGSAEAIEHVEIRWPSGTVQVVEGARMDAVNRVTEPRE